MGNLFDRYFSGNKREDDSEDDSEEENENPEKKYSFVISSDLKGLERDKNYGILPLLTLVDIFQFLFPRELLNCSMSCELFYGVIQSQYFWRLYYLNLSVKPTNKVFNWKREVFLALLPPNKKESYYFRNFFDIRNKMHLYTLGQGYDQTMKMLLIGTSWSGKSCLVVRKVRGSYYRANRSKTPSLSSQRVIHNGVHINCLYYDTGDEILTSEFWREFSDVDGILVCFDLTDPESCRKSTELYRSVRSRLSSRCQVVFAGCKSDIGYKVMKGEDFGKNVLQREGIGYSEFCYCSASEGKNIHTPFGMLIERIFWSKKNRQKLTFSY